MPKRPSADYNSAHTGTPDAAESAASATPLSILLETMRAKYAKGDLDGAVALARIAAPYLHPRIPAATPASEPEAADLLEMTDADLDALRSRD